HGILLEFVKNRFKTDRRIMCSKSKTDPVSLRPRLKQLEKEGVKLYLNGVPSTTEYIMKHCVNEDTVYMPDYVIDENGKLKEIRYDQIFHN
ncbi:MAG: hypothetical protein K2G39_11725, partial [Lachnospiraceae bacterium]|nr:hypothetical protein [Lachnospiraceae bacterium]